MKDNNRIIEELKQYRTKAPAGFAEQVMEALPAWRPAKRKSWWPSRGQWIVPMLAGTAVSLVIMLGLFRFATQGIDGSQVSFHFELHAPGAQRVELLGTFNNWESGDIVLVGPDASGHWTAEVALPEGRYEYIFLVDGEQWIADPKGAIHRPDGFGRVNTVIKVYDDDNV